MSTLNAWGLCAPWFLFWVYVFVSLLESHEKLSHKGSGARGMGILSEA